MSDSWADRPPPSWMKSNSFRKVKDEPSGDGWSTPSSPVHRLDVPSSPGHDAAFRRSSLTISKPDASVAMVTSPTSPKASWDTAAQASHPTTPRLPPPPAASTRADSITPAGLERQSSHRKTTSWGGGGSPTAGGKSHRRTRSIEGVGTSMDASETFRAELERIGSISSNGSIKVPVPPPERPALALSPPKAVAIPLQAPQPSLRRSSVGSPLKQPLRKSSDAIPPLDLAPVAAKPQAVRVASKGPSKEQELISWDDVKDQKEVYQAVRTADGRQALVKAGDGANQEELLYLEDPPKATPDMSVAQGSHASALYYVPTAAGPGPMYAYPVQYPDGRIMYHILPPQMLSPMPSPHTVAQPASAQNVASPPYPCSPTAASTPPGHQRHGSQGTPVGPQAGPTAFSNAAYAPAFGSAGMAFPSPHLYANSSGPLSPQLSQASSGLVLGTSPNHAAAMSPAGSGHLPAHPAYYAQHAQTNHDALLEQLAGMRLATAKDDPFGGSAVWAT